MGILLTRFFHSNNVSHRRYKVMAQVEKYCKDYSGRGIIEFKSEFQVDKTVGIIFFEHI